MTSIPSLLPSKVRLVALGGLGEIGMNCMVLEQNEDIAIIDCGVTFPSSDLGIDIYHPMFNYLIQRRDRVRGVFITHGHEDHIGALPYLLKHVSVPIWGPRHALELIKQRLVDHDFDLTTCDLRPVSTREQVRVGSFTFEPIRVTHSIAEATALAIRTHAGTIVHTGDFKFDATPPDGETTDELRLSELGDEGVRLLLSDSTNIDSEGSSLSESEICQNLEQLIEPAQNRVVLGMFASNVQRLVALQNIAQRSHRKIVLLGRSVINHVRAAHAASRIHWPSDLMIAPEQAKLFPKHQLLILASGTQGERMSALMRLATRSHPVLRLDENDTVILSSRIIPGNDRAVYDMMAHFLRQNVHLVTRITHRAIHTSGHAHRDEQRKMIRLIRPKTFIPVHGTLHHLKRHAELAAEMGVPERWVIENGDIIDVDKGYIEHAGKAPSGRVATFDGERLSDEVIKERSQIGRAGILSISVAINAKGVLLADPVVQTKGVIDESQNHLLLAASRAVAQNVTDYGSEKSDDDMIDLIRLAARRVIESRTGIRPVVMVTLHRF